jgi:protein gp37
MLANTLVAPGCDPSDPFAPRFWPNRLAELHQVKGWERGRTLTIARFEQKPRGIFLCDMGDLFGRLVPPEWTCSILEAVKGCPQHRFYLLTKQPQELQKWSPFPPNAWVGVSAWDFWSYENACHYLQDVGATVKYISLEPLLDWKIGEPTFYKVGGISWLIVGAQTKPSVKVPGEWIDDIVSSAKSAGVAVFLKNSLRSLVEDEHFKFELLQEFPRSEAQDGKAA